MTGKSSRIKEPVEEKVAKPKKEVEVKEESEVKVPKINEQDKVIGNSKKTYTLTEQTRCFGAWNTKRGKWYHIIWRIWMK